MSTQSAISSSPAHTLGTPAPSGTSAAAAAAAVDSNATVRQAPFGFAQRTNFDARQELQNTRSRHFRVPPAPLDDDIWRRQPPDFRPQAWAPRPPKRNSRDAVQPWRYRLDSDERYAVGNKQLPSLAQQHQQRQQQKQQQPPRMQTLFRLVRPDTAKRRAVREGFHPRDLYTMPMPHDFRQLPPIQSLGLPEFTTATDKDPYNIHFLTRNTDTIVGPLHETKNIRDASGTMWSAVRQPQKWDPKLHLEQKRFPNRSCEYSRYRPRNRDPFEAFMDTVEVGLEKRWLAEKLSKSMVPAKSKGPDTDRSALKMAAA